MNYIKAYAYYTNMWQELMLKFDPISSIFQNSLCHSLSQQLQSSQRSVLKGNSRLKGTRMLDEIALTQALKL